MVEAEEMGETFSLAEHTLTVTHPWDLCPVAPLPPAAQETR